MICTWLGDHPLSRPLFVGLLPPSPSSPLQILLSPATHRQLSPPRAFSLPRPPAERPPDTTMPVTSELYPLLWSTATTTQMCVHGKSDACWSGLLKKTRNSGEAPSVLLPCAPQHPTRPGQSALGLQASGGWKRKQS